MYITTINEKENMDLKVSKRVYEKVLREGKDGEIIY